MIMNRQADKGDNYKEASGYPKWNISSILGREVATETSNIFPVEKSQDYQKGELPSTSFENTTGAQRINLKTAIADEYVHRLHELTERMFPSSFQDKMADWKSQGASKSNEPHSRIVESDEIGTDYEKKRPSSSNLFQHENNMMMGSNLQHGIIRGKPESPFYEDATQSNTLFHEERKNLETIQTPNSALEQLFYQQQEWMKYFAMLPRQHSEKQDIFQLKTMLHRNFLQPKTAMGNCLLPTNITQTQNERVYLPQPVFNPQHSEMMLKSVHERYQMFLRSLFTPPSVITRPTINPIFSIKDSFGEQLPVPSVNYPWKTHLSPNLFNPVLMTSPIFGSVQNGHSPPRRPLKLNMDMSRKTSYPTCSQSEYHFQTSLKQRKEKFENIPKTFSQANVGKERKSHRCMYCGKDYSRKYGLKIHIRTHTGYKPLKCKICGRPFGDPSNLNKHVRLHAEGETPYRCDICGKVLVRRRDLERHTKSRHPDKN